MTVQATPPPAAASTSAFAFSAPRGAALALGVLLLLMMMTAAAPAAAQDRAAQDGVEDRAEPKVVLAIHGGAGTILPENMTDEQEQQYRAKLREALEAGYAVIDEGGASMDAVLAAITLMEDSPLFNAGRGAVFTHERTIQHDASVMDGRTLKAGAVAGVMHIESPITLARMVMEESPHVMLTGDGAEAFAEQQGMELVPNETFHTERRMEQIDRVLEEEGGEAGRTSRRAPAPEASAPDGPRTAAAPPAARAATHEADLIDLQKEYGTVGAVALDQEGNLAAGTSTGGMTNKRWGRVGDSPIIGAGTYAENATCAVSSTGHGEYFIRGVIAHDIAARMRYLDASVQEAAHAVIMDELTEMGGTGGVIALDAEGNVSMPFNTAGMYRGTVDEEGNVTIRIYGNEE